MNELSAKTERVLPLALVSLLMTCVLLVRPGYAQNISFKAAPGSPVGVGSGPASVAVGDFNGDGILDLVVANANDNTVSVLLGKGDGTFSAPASFKVNRNPFPTPCLTGCGSVPIAVAVGDFNQDGKLDIAVTNLPINDVCKLASLFGDVCSSVAILLGKGDGTFQDSNQFDTGGHLPVSLTVSDFNRDGKLDLAIANLNSANVQILLGDGKGNFGAAKNAPVTVGTHPTSVAVGDFNGDGKPDLAVANGDDGTISVLLGNGDGTFGGATNFAVGARPVSIAVADFNGDGKPDLAVANSLDSTISILFGDGTGSFPTGKLLGAGRDPFSVAGGDFNGDGKSDLAVVNRYSGTAAVLLGNGDGTFANSRSFPVGSNPLSLAVGDFNGDTQLDLAVVNLSNGAVSILLNNTDITPPATTATPMPGPNQNGWNNTRVTVTLSSTDSEPGGTGVKEIHYSIGSNPPVVVPGASVTVNFTTEGIFQLSYFAVDKAGNVEATHSLTVRIDLTPPVLIMPTLAASYLLNSTLTLTFGATDALSGVATVQATLNGNPVTSGTTVTLTHLATNTFTLTATDLAGNTATQTATFSVIYNFVGFLPPIPNHRTGLFKLGSTVPVKFELTDVNGTLVSTAVAMLTIQMISGNTLLGTPVPATASGNANVGDLFRFDGTQYVFNWSTKPVSTGSWQLQARLDDGTVHTVVLRIE